MSSLREGIRKLARGKNGLGFFCSAALCLKREGAGATAALIRTHREEKDFERRTKRSLRMDPQVFEAQRRDSEGSDLRFSICVPLYNTPAAFLQDMLDSVKGQSWENWELLLADGSDDAHPEVREACEAAAAADSRIRYRKLEANGGISENTNAALAMAKGNWIALMDHDDVLGPSALWETDRKSVV